MARRFFAGVALLALAVAISPGPTYAGLFFADDFSTFANGNLVGQGAWTTAAGSSTLPIQVAGGQVVIPGGQTGDNQDALRLFGATPSPAAGTTSLFLGTHINVQSSPAGTPSFLLALVDTLSGFSNERVATQASGAGFVFGARVTGQGSDPFTFGSNVLSFNTPYNLIVQADMTAGAGNDVIKLFVNPAQGDVSMETPYLVHVIGAGATDPTSLGAVQISQFQSATVGITGATLGTVRVADDFANAAAIPEPATALASFALLASLLATRRAARCDRADIS